jgi:NADPH-dependent glutamate synthase beta subunit-like oxidoreductase
MLSIAEGGYKVYLVEKAPALGGHMAQLDKTFPTNDCSMCTLAPKLVEAGRHLNIDIVTNSELIGLEGEPGDFKAKVFHHARFVDPDKCTSCGECVPVCPVKVGTPTTRTSASAPPSTSSTRRLSRTLTRSRRGHRPAARLPVATRRRATWLCRGGGSRGLPVPASRTPSPPCGRVCTHRETDAPEASGRTDRHRRSSASRQWENLPPVEPAEIRYDERVAIVGAGPSGLTAARDLTLLGYRTTVFEARSEAGGMLRFGIPEYRLPSAALRQDIDRVLALGVELRLNQAIGRDLTVDSLLAGDYRAVYLAVGLHAGRSLPIPGGDAEGVFTAVDLLRDATLGRPLDVGKRVVVIGGGDVAYDAGRTALRLGADEVTLVCIEDAASVPASREEREEGADEGIALVCSRMPTGITTDADGRARAIAFADCALGEADARGWRPPVPVEGAHSELPCDTVVFATGQGLIEDFADGLASVRIERNQIVADRDPGRPIAPVCSPGMRRHGTVDVDRGGGGDDAPPARSTTTSVASACSTGRSGSARPVRSRPRWLGPTQKRGGSCRARTGSNAGGRGGRSPPASPRSRRSPRPGAV